MRNLRKGRKFGRERGQRNALLKSLAVSLIRDEKITTTQAKAKELRPYVEKLVTRARVNTLANRRLLLSRIGEGSAVEKLMKTIGPKYAERKGGYTRIVKLVPRVSDSATRALIEFV